MSFQISLQKRIQQLRKAQQSIPIVLIRTAKNATMRAVEAATDKTPPTVGSLKGTNTRTGELKQHWATDSQVEPLVTGGKYETTLANDKEYASYVDQGHRMDRHFVPGLVLNEESGMLEYNPNKKGGIVVGTKTKYVRGRHMVDRGKEAYEKTILSELDKEIQRLMK